MPSPVSDATRTPTGLGVREALAAFLALVVGQMAGTVLMLAFAGALTDMRDLLAGGAHSPARIPYELVGGIGGGGLLCVSVGYYFVRVRARQSFRTAIGWALGPPRALAAGAGLGLGLAALFLLMAGWLLPYDDSQGHSDLTTLAATPGIPRFLWTVLALFLAPLLEEFLFRGVVYTGVARDRGPAAGAVVTTVLFCAMHLGEAQYYWPGLGVIALVGLVTVGLRIRTGCLGPAIAAHFTYNGALVLTAYLTAGW